MQNPRNESGLASIEAIKTAFIGLSGDELLKLKQIARIRSLGLPHSTWEDLLQEALFRALTGARNWPVTVPFIAFLAQTMRSIAADERRRALDLAVISEADFSSESDAPSHFDELAATTTTPESIALTNIALHEIEQLFSKDPEALAILQGLALGSMPIEIQSSSGMSALQYTTAQKRIQRMLAKHYGKN